MSDIIIQVQETDKIINVAVVENPIPVEVDITEETVTVDITEQNNIINIEINEGGSSGIRMYVGATPPAAPQLYDLWLNTNV